MLSLGRRDGICYATERQKLDSKVILAKFGFLIKVLSRIQAFCNIAA
jgi:hypothetical protein